MPRQPNDQGGPEPAAEVGLEQPAGSGSGEQSLAFELGDRVSLALPVRYLKTADPMPMLRPPDLVDPGEVGVVQALRPLDQLAIRFRRGTFLITARELKRPGAEG